MIKYFLNNFIYFLILLASLLSFFSAVVYRVYKLNYLGVTLSLFFVFVFFIILFFYHYVQYNKKNKNIFFLSIPQKKEEDNTKKCFYLYYLPYFIIYLISFYVLFKTSTNNSIISPWQVVPSYFFFLYFFLTLLLAIIIFSKKTGKKIFFVSLHYFLSFSVALIVYKIGYGFDPFIHQATMEIIDKKGFIEPKNFYYLGQYGLIIIFHKLFFIPIEFLNKILVPFFASLFLPFSVFHFLESKFNNKKVNFFLLLFLLFLPFGIFITTTPQNLSYLFLFLSLFFGLSYKNKPELFASVSFSLASFAIHPISGIPAIFFSLILLVNHFYKKSFKKIIYVFIFIFSSVSLPLAFYFVEKNNINNFNNSSVNEKTQFLSDFIKNISFSSNSSENFILNFIYLYGFNIKIIIGIISFAGIFIACRKRKDCGVFFSSLLMSVSLLVSYVLTKKISFNFLIDYEQNNYTERILILAVVFLVPFIIIFLYWLIERARIDRTVKIIMIIFSCFLITTSLYLSYSRFDNYFNSRCYSTGESDINAVLWIEENHKDDYIVLANQQVSVAALKEFGFNRYYNNIYFYPIPTGEYLYQYYLKMVYDKPEKKTIKEAMDFAGVNEGYFVLNDYWWAFSKILKEAKMEADGWEEIDNGKSYIFYYKK